MLIAYVSPPRDVNAFPIAIDLAVPSYLICEKVNASSAPCATIIFDITIADIKNNDLFIILNYLLYPLPLDDELLLPDEVELLDELVFELVFEDGGGVYEELLLTLLPDDVFLVGWL